MSSSRSTTLGSSSKNGGDHIRKVIDISATGEYYKMFVGVDFGDAQRRSEVCQLLVNTGSPLTWVTNTAYKNAIYRIISSPPKLERIGSFVIDYNSDGIGIIRGELYEGIVSFHDKGTCVKQTFGIADDSNTDRGFKNALDNMKVDGMIGLGSNTKDGRTELYDLKGYKLKELFPTLLDNLKAQKKIPDNIVGITIGLPNEVGVGNYISKGLLIGGLTFGGPKEGTTMKEILAKKSKLTSQYAVTLKLSYEDQVIKRSCEGIIDSGTVHTLLPDDVMSKYINIVNKKGKIVKFDKDSKMYYLEKKDFKYLKDIEFHISQEKTMALFKFPPTAQIIPPACNKVDNNKLLNDKVFLIFKGTSDKRIVLGASWMMWYYITLGVNSNGDNKIGISEIKEMKNHRWSSLQGYY